MSLTLLLQIFMTLIECNRMQLANKGTNDWKNLSVKLGSHETTINISLTWMKIIIIIFK